MNLGLLGVFVFPPLILIPSVFSVTTEFYGPYWWLLKWPTAAGLLVAIPLTSWLFKSGVRPRRAAFFINLSFFVIFALVAGNIRSDAMRSALEGKNPDCFFKRSFLGSIGLSRAHIQEEIHAVAIVDGKVLLWSHKLQNFYEAGEGLYRNLRLYNCERFLPVKSTPQPSP